MRINNNNINNNSSTLQGLQVEAWNAIFNLLFLPRQLWYCKLPTYGGRTVGVILSRSMICLCLVELTRPRNQAPLLSLKCGKSNCCVLALLKVRVRYCCETYCMHIAYDSTCLAVFILFCFVSFVFHAPPLPSFLAGRKPIILIPGAVAMLGQWPNAQGKIIS